MVHAAEAESMSYPQYVAFERTSEIRHEWLAGAVHAMAGDTIEHAALALAVGSELRARLQGKPCRVFGSDARIRVQATGLATYPDLSIVCGRLATDPDDDQAIANPVLLVEVLSDTTEAYDRGEKFAHYRRISSLREYVLVSQRERRIEIHRRNEAGRWELFEFFGGGFADLASVGCAIPIHEIYRDPLANNDREKEG